MIDLRSINEKIESMERRNTPKPVDGQVERRGKDRRVIPRFSNSEFRAALKFVDVFFKAYIFMLLAALVHEVYYGFQLGGKGTTRGIFFGVVLFTLAVLAFRCQRRLKSYFENESIARLVQFTKSGAMNLLITLATAAILYGFTVIFRH